MGICTFSQRQAYSSDAYDDTLNPNNYSTATTLEEDLNYIRSTIKQLTVLVGGGPDWIDVPGSLSTATITAGGLMSAADKQKLDTIETGAQVNPTPTQIFDSIKTDLVPYLNTQTGLNADTLDNFDSSIFLQVGSPIPWSTLTSVPYGTDTIAGITKKHPTNDYSISDVSVAANTWQTSDLNSRVNALSAGTPVWGSETGTVGSVSVTANWVIIGNLGLAWAWRDGPGASDYFTVYGPLTSSVNFLSFGVAWGMAKVSSGGNATSFTLQGTPYTSNSRLAMQFNYTMDTGAASIYAYWLFKTN